MKTKNVIRGQYWLIGKYANSGPYTETQKKELELEFPQAVFVPYNGMQNAGNWNAFISMK